MLKTGKFVITKKSDAVFQFDYRDSNDTIILYSGNYTRKMMCLNGIESVKRNSKDSFKFFKKTSQSGTFYFNLKSFNGKIIAVSEFFENRSLRDNAIDLIKIEAVNASIEDQSKLRKYSYAVDNE
ncbi:DUF1508 domain-containing protein [Flavobacterium lipolyticum]|uniref:YegP family protein n=1 Tax=Flavobacterium lipolyticum TaxID=2893754 RepID=A0ABS8M435_9FLAO|nr:YegP family protein [Flavobacterium sp. F-126]MCC9019550.1 YegP family protein [Flavobacterium sp. F-126]